MGSFEGVVDSIKERLGIVDVVSEYLALKKRGANYIGLCPFHSEKTPSFTVNESKQFFHCFGCGEGGNIFTFVMKIENMPFSEALKKLAKKAGVEIKPFSGLSESIKKEIDEGYKVNKLASDFYVKVFNNVHKSMTAAKYLEKRGFEKQTLEKFHVGFAPDDWGVFCEVLKEKNMPFKIAEKVGLIISKESKTGYYDRFRGRVMFPIFNLNGEIAGFGGRTVEEKQPKYLNSPESEIFNKGSVLYGLYQAKNDIAKEDSVFVVEGYLDLLSLFEKGIKNVVATLGTALTSRHIELIKRFTKRIFLVFDGDEAGEKAALRVMPVFLETGIYPKVMKLPEGEDPDTFIRKAGVKGWAKAVSESVEIVQFYIQEVLSKKSLQTIEEKVEAFNEIKSVIARLSDSLQRSLYIKNISERLNIPEKFFSGHIVPFESGSSGRSEKKKLKSEEEQFNEEVLIMVVKDGLILKEFAENEMWNYIENKKNQETGRYIASVYKEYGELNVEKILPDSELYNGDKIGELTELLIKSENYISDSDVLKRLRIRYLRKIEKDIVVSIAMLKGDEGEYLKLLNRQREIKDEIKDILRSIKG